MQKKIAELTPMNGQTKECRSKNQRLMVISLSLDSMTVSRQC